MSPKLVSVYPLAGLSAQQALTHQECVDYVPAKLVRKAWWMEAFVIELIRDLLGRFASAVQLDHALTKHAKLLSCSYC